MNPTTTMQPPKVAGEAADARGETAPVGIALSLISHTNVGKTALARTLLDHDVGEVRDEAHVTASAEHYEMIRSSADDVLTLWDTPGFGDSARLARRLETMDKPIIGFLAMVWDRWRERALWSSQQAVRNVRDEADVVLYLVNASERPADSGFLAPELRILEWIGKPVIVLLNQMGPPRAPREEAADIARWRDAIGKRPLVRGVLSLDAFARCWVQEGTLLAEVAQALPSEKQAGFARLMAAWEAERWRRFEEAIDAIAAPLALASCDREAVPNLGLRESLLEVGKAMGRRAEAIDPAKSAAMRSLSERLDSAIQQSTNRLISIHRLDGSAAAEVIARLSENVTTDAPVNEGKAAVIGGFVSGALSGLVADLASGGLTFGAGLLAGGIVGAVGGAGLARGFNLVRGKTESMVRWNETFVEALVPAAVLRYLAVAHYGRGRGKWEASEYPRFWRDVVASIIERQGGVAAILEMRRVDCDSGFFAELWRRKLRDISLAVLAELYPNALPPPSPPTENAA